MTEIYQIKFSFSGTRAKIVNVPDVPNHGWGLDKIVCEAFKFTEDSGIERLAVIPSETGPFYIPLKDMYSFDNRWYQHYTSLTFIEGVIVRLHDEQKYGFNGYIPPFCSPIELLQEQTVEEFLTAVQGYYLRLFGNEGLFADFTQAPNILDKNGKNVPLRYASEKIGRRFRSTGYELYAWFQRY